MSTQFAKPENALKRAEELIGVDQKAQALQVLHSVITAKKFRTWQPILEKILVKYIELCVDMRKGKLAKDGLHQYRVTCQQYNIGSLEVVVKHFLEQAEERAKQAQSKADKVILDIEDLEAEESVESMILSSVSGEDSKDRTDREIVTPWLKFLWETYRTVLEILRNNQKLETVYQDTAQRAFTFCLKYKRNTEFRRLCEMLRTHLANIKYAQTPQTSYQGISLSSPESLQLHLDTRFAQLSVAIDLELWQEAFRSIEDVHGLLILSKKQPKPQMLINYFQKLSLIFWTSENYLFHAQALNKLFNLARAHKTLTDEETKLITTTLLLSILSVPVEDLSDLNTSGAASTSSSSGDIFYSVQKERSNRMASLLSFNLITTSTTSGLSRSSLLEDFMGKNLLSSVIPELKDVFFIMEQKFNPLQFCASLKPKLDFISGHPNLKQYAKQLERLMFVRLLQQLAKVYDIMKISEFYKLVDFVKPHQVEKQIVEAVKNRYVEVKIDHQNGILNFKTQSLESDHARGQLVHIAMSLQDAIKSITSTAPTSVITTLGLANEETKKQKRKEYFTLALHGLAAERERLSARKAYIEKKKELYDKVAKIKAKEMEDKEKVELKKREDIEKERLGHLAKEMEATRKKKELEAKRKEELQVLRTVMVQKGATEAELAQIESPDFDPDEWLKKRMHKHEVEQRELAKRLVKVGKKLDWLERAKRDEERPLYAQHHTQQMKDDEAFHHEQSKLFIKSHRENWEKEVEEKKRLSRMLKDKASFEEIILKRRQSEYEQLKKERDQRLAEKRAKLLEERAKREKEEEAKRVEQEKARKQKEEEERKRKEEEDKKRQEQEEKRRKLQEQADVQRKREEEVLRRQEESMKDERDKKSTGKFVPPALREKDKEPPKEDRERESSSAPSSSSGRYVPPVRRSDTERRDSSRDLRDSRDSRDREPIRDSRDRDREPTRGFPGRDSRPSERDIGRPFSRERDYPRDSERREPERRESSRDLDRRDSDRREPERRESSRDLDRREPERRDSSRDLDRREPERRDYDRRDSDRREPARRDSDRREPERRDSSRDLDRREPERRDSSRDLDRREPERRDYDRRDSGRRDYDRREPERRDSDRREPERRDSSRDLDKREPERRDSERREPERRDSERREPERRESSRDLDRRDSSRDSERREPERRDSSRDLDKREPERREPERRDSTRDSGRERRDSVGTKEEKKESPRDPKSEGSEEDGFTTVTKGRKKK